MVTTFAEWCEAVTKECIKLRDVERYLNEDGKARLNAFCILSDLANYAADANDMLAWISDIPGDLSYVEIEMLESEHLQLPISRLRRIACAEPVDYSRLADDAIERVRRMIRDNEFVDDITVDPLDGVIYFVVMGTGGRKVSTFHFIDNSEEPTLERFGNYLKGFCKTYKEDHA